MQSWQLQVSLLFLRFKKLFAPPPGADVVRSRRDLASMARTFGRPGQWRVTPVQIGDLAAEWVEAQGASTDKVVLYFHGGSYNSGSPETHRSLVGSLARAFSGRCLSLDYHLAPEHPFPAALEDARLAYEWLLAQGVPANSMVLAGDSAGGGLCVTLMVVLRDAGLPLPAAAVLFCPWTDLAMTGETLVTLARRDLLLHPETLRQEAQIYLAGADPRNPLASPLYADLSGLPPHFIQAGAHDILLADSTRLAERLQQAGVPVLLDVEPGGQHDYQFGAAFVPEARQALERAGKFILGN